jgi:plastocyanin
MSGPSNALLFLLLALLFISKCNGQTTTKIAWQKGRYYPTYSVVVGDTARFVWSSTHNVYRHPSGSCDTTGSVQLAPTTNDGTYSYTFEASDEGKSITFACQVDDNCENGMLIMFNVGPVVRNPVPKPLSAHVSQSAWHSGASAFLDSLLSLEDEGQLSLSGSPSAISLQQPTGSSELTIPSAGQYSYSFENIGEQTAVTFSCNLGYTCPAGMMMKFTLGTTIQGGSAAPIASCECVSSEGIMVNVPNQGNTVRLPVMVNVPNQGNTVRLPVSSEDIMVNMPTSEGNTVRIPDPEFVNSLFSQGIVQQLKDGDRIRLGGVNPAARGMRVMAQPQRQQQQEPLQPNQKETIFLRFQFTNSLQHLEVAEDHLLYLKENPEIPVPARNITVGDILLHPYNLHGSDVRVIQIEVVTRERNQNSEATSLLQDPLNPAHRELLDIVLAGLNPPTAQSTSLNAAFNPIHLWCPDNSQNWLCSGMKSYAQHASRLIHWGEKQSIIMQWTIFPMAFVLLSIIYFMECLFYFGRSYSSPMLMLITLMTYAFLAMPKKDRVRVKKSKKY